MSGDWQSVAALPRPAPLPPARRWATSPWQRLRLTPLYLAIAAAPVAARWVARTAPCRWPPWRPGVTVVLVADAAMPDWSAVAVDLAAALGALKEPGQLLVDMRASSGALDHVPLPVEWVEASSTGGRIAAIAAALPQVRHDWVYVLDAGLRPAAGALGELLRWRGETVFAIAARIGDVRPGTIGTGRSNWYADRLAVHFGTESGANPDGPPRPQLWASDRATLFRSCGLRERIAASVGYRRSDAGEAWELIDWGLAAWREGRVVLFAPRSTVAAGAGPGSGSSAAPSLGSSCDRQTTVPADALHNRVLFEMRNAVAGRAPADLLLDVCDQPYATQRQLADWATVRAVARARRDALRAPRWPTAAELGWLPERAWPTAHVARFERPGLGFQLGAGPGEPGTWRAMVRQAMDGPRRPCALVITPFAVFPPRHGGARRTAALLASLAADYDVVLVGDEGILYDPRSLDGFDGLRAVHLVQRDSDPAAQHAADLDTRMRAHCHPTLVAAVAAAQVQFSPVLVQVEHVELAPLVTLRRPGERWLLDLHDAPARGDFASPLQADGFERTVLAGYDAVLVCSTEDRALVSHPAVVTVANGSTVAVAGYHPSGGAELLFMGPFRYPPNLAAAIAFARTAFPAIRAAHPDATLRVLGGDGAPEFIRVHPELAQPGVRVEGHRDDVAAALAQCALTVNPLTGIRGSAVKLVESLAAGRVCVSTTEAARGFGARGLSGLITVADVVAMVAPIVGLLADPAQRWRRERPDLAELTMFGWDACLAPYRTLCAQVTESAREVTSQ